MAHFEHLTDAPKYRQYRQRLLENGLTVHQIRPLEVLRKRNGEVLFAFLDLDVETPDGTFLPPTVFIRGDYVAVLTVLRAAETGTPYLVAVRQRRVATGGYFYEHPAGMMDLDADPRAVAVRELEEETGLRVSNTELKALTDAPLYSSPGLLDERGYAFYVELTKPQAEIDALRGDRRRADGGTEDIFVEVLTFAEAFELFVHVNGLLMLHLYLQHKGWALADVLAGKFPA